MATLVYSSTSGGVRSSTISRVRIGYRAPIPADSLLYTPKLVVGWNMSRYNAVDKTATNESIYADQLIP